jgi:hypothetical protein
MIKINKIMSNKFLYKQSDLQQQKTLFKKISKCFSKKKNKMIKSKEANLYITNNKCNLNKNWNNMIPKKNKKQKQEQHKRTTTFTTKQSRKM